MGAGVVVERAEDVQNAVNSVKQALGSPSKPTPLETRKFSVNSAFKRAGKLVKAGVIAPSRFALRDWCKEEYSELPSDKDIKLWQSDWLKVGLIEKYQLPNGKHSYKLKVGENT